MVSLETSERTRLLQRYGKELEVNSVIYSEGDGATHSYLLQEGRVRLVRRVRRADRSITVLKPGDFFGEEALVEPAVRRNTAVALSPVSLLSLPQQVLGELLTGNPPVAQHVLAQLVRRLSQAEEQLENVMLRDTPSRVVNAILKLCAGCEQNKLGHVISISPLELASRVGLDVDVIKDAVRQLKEGGYLKIVGEQLVVPDQRPLMQLYQLLGVKEEVRGSAI